MHISRLDAVVGVARHALLSAPKPALWGTLAVLGLSLLTGVVWAAPSQPAPHLAAVVAVPIRQPEPLEPDAHLTAVKIRRGSTLGGLLASYGISGSAVRQAALDLYDLARIRPDRGLSFRWAQGEDLPIALEYAIDEDRTLSVVRTGTTWTASLHEVAYTTDVGSRDFTLTSSLWNDGVAAGLRPVDLLTIAEVFEYELDFNTELREGARVSLVGDVLSSDERPDKLGTLHAIRIENRGAVLVAVRHAQRDGTVSWYKPDGRSMRRPFLRSPLAFDARVTSGFGRRFHPIAKTYRTHLGTDFGAPTGTPVRAVADGVVAWAARNGGHGNYVKLDHEGPYLTSYSHLSRIKVRKGDKVKQGDVIGLVGTTGYSTGPHLHYQIWIEGKLVDAMTARLPHQAPLLRAELPAFLERARAVLPLLPGETPEELAKAGARPASGG